MLSDVEARETQRRERVVPKEEEGNVKGRAHAPYLSLSGHSYECVSKNVPRRLTVNRKSVW